MSSTGMALSIFMASAQHCASYRIGSRSAYVLIILHRCQQDSGRLTQYIKDNRINETESSKLRAGNTDEAKCKIALRVHAVKSGLSLEVGYKFASDVFHQYRELAGKDSW